MDDNVDRAQPLSYAAPPDARERSSRALPVLLTVNSLVAFGALWLIPVARHIYSCTEGVKWCHLQAYFYGVPGVLVVATLTGLTMAYTFDGRPTSDRRRVLKFTAWLPLAVAASVLVGLFVAVAHNS